ncbi:hypothetical protein BJ170DRAFT_736501 [Xylariales sp. AK1849]|nr:hypothetical protein BJ170DRAFT_736501 [Xylariales sp. AK1849]
MEASNAGSIYCHTSSGRTRTTGWAKTPLRGIFRTDHAQKALWITTTTSSSGATTTSDSDHSSTEAASSSKDVSNGAVAGISVAAVIGGMTLAALVGWFILRRRERTWLAPSQDDSEIGTTKTIIMSQDAAEIGTTETTIEHQVAAELGTTETIVMYQDSQKYMAVPSLARY